MNRVDEVFFSQQSNSKILLVVITDMKVAKCILFSPLIAHHQVSVAQIIPQRKQTWLC